MADNFFEDYASAASRHLRDSRLLLQHECFDNASYLVGYVVECGIKALIALAGPPPRIHDLQNLSGASLDFAASLSYAVRRYPLDLNTQIINLHKRWNVELRYNKSGFMNPQDAQTLIADAGDIYRATIGEMTLDGLLERLPQ